MFKNSLGSITSNLQREGELILKVFVTVYIEIVTCYSFAVKKNLNQSGS